MSSIIICGLPGAGKTTVAQLLNEIGAIQPVEVGTSVDLLLSALSDKSQLLIVECPVILCFQRTRRSSQRFDEFVKTLQIEQKERLLKYMTDLPNCTIIKNDLSLDHLRLQIKKFLKKQ